METRLWRSALRSWKMRRAKRREWGELVPANKRDWINLLDNNQEQRVKEDCEHLLLPRRWGRKRKSRGTHKNRPPNDTIMVLVTEESDEEKMDTHDHTSENMDDPEQMIVSPRPPTITWKLAPIFSKGFNPTPLVKKTQKTKHTRKHVGMTNRPIEKFLVRGESTISHLKPGLADNLENED